MLSNYVLSLIQKFHRIAPWTEVAELRQVAALACLESARSYKPTKGASLATYQAAAVRYMLSHHVDYDRSPVTSGKSKLRDMRGMSRAPLEELDRGGRYVDDLELGIDIATAKARLRAVQHLMSPAATAVLLEERKPAEVARAMRMPVGQVYRATLRARRALARNEELRQLVAG
ncbi:MAG: hypothetical protein ABFE07_15265 [Armatimonadia bacterium]